MTEVKIKETDFSPPGTDEIRAWAEDGPDSEVYGDELAPKLRVPLDLHHHPPAALAVSDSEIIPSSDDFLFNHTMPNKVHWSVPWSDLMMTMFILFVVMYIYHSSKKEFLAPDGLGIKSAISYSTPSPSAGDRKAYDYHDTLPELFDLSTKTLRARNLNNFASVDLVADKAVRIILAGDILFEIGKAELKSEAKERLKQLAPIIKKTPYKVNVVGHTDNLPVQSFSLGSNWELSVLRACAVARFFIDEMHLPERTFFLSGHSYFQPLRPHSSEENRALNRRVEIILTRERPYGLPVNRQRITSELQTAMSEADAMIPQ